MYVVVDFFLVIFVRMPPFLINKHLVVGMFIHVHLPTAGNVLQQSMQFSFRMMRCLLENVHSAFLSRTYDDAPSVVFCGVTQCVV